ncbi:hypothetical protein [Staphylococcus pseudoxylosus]|uniref:hypothetical protein n=1 Tax=Staphylococcus pseudoxylosus TaxID=2282419 RepID=UPI00390657F6
MNSYDDVYTTIEKLLNSKEISNYKIKQDTGVSYGAISELRNGKRHLKNITLETAGKLYEYAKAHLNE